MFSLVEAFLMLSYTGMLSCRGFLDVIVHRDGVCSLLDRGFRGFIDVIVHRDGVCSLLWRLSCSYRKQGWRMLSPV